MQNQISVHNENTSEKKRKYCLWLDEIDLVLLFDENKALKLNCLVI